MYPHQGGKGPGQYDYGGSGEGMGPGGDRSGFPQNGAFADFMRSNDPNNGGGDSSGGGSGGFGRQSSAWQHPGRGMTMSPSVRQSHGMSRRATSAAVARLPSLRSVQGGPMGPMEPPVTEGASGVEPMGMQGVAMGTMYDTDSHSNSTRSRSRYSHAAAPTAAPSNAGFNPSHGRLPGTAPPSSSQNSRASESYLPTAPYQEMMQTFGREDPAVERARMSMAGTRKQAELPLPQPGRPQGPTSQAMEPAMPQSRLGRRILTQKPVRQPDFVRAKVAGESSKAMPLDYTNVECVTCRSTIEIPKSAVVILCPTCEQVHPAASCRVVRVGY